MAEEVKEKKDKRQKKYNPDKKKKVSCFQGCLRIRRVRHSSERFMDNDQGMETETDVYDEVEIEDMNYEEDAQIFNKQIEKYLSFFTASVDGKTLSYSRMFTS